MSDFTALRTRMVERQIIPAHIKDPGLVHAFLTVAREKCIPRQFARVAYMGDIVPLGRGQYLPSPLSCAIFLNQAGLVPSDRVLYIGQSGVYVPALLGKMGVMCVMLLEREGDVAPMQELLEELFVFSVHIVVGALEEGCSEMGPFDKILIEAQVDFVPNSLLEQLEEGGSLLCFHTKFGRIGNLVKYRKEQGKILLLDLQEMPLPTFKCFREEKNFVF